MKKYFKKKHIASHILIILGSLSVLIGVFGFDFTKLCFGFMSIVSGLQWIMIDNRDEYIEEITQSQDFLDFQALVHEFNEEKEGK